MTAPSALLQARRNGSARNGTVDLEAFDIGMAETLGATVQDSPDGSPGYYLTVPGVEPAPGLPGIAITYENPEDAYGRWVVPCILMVRESMADALNRRMSGCTQYAAPADHSVPRTLRGTHGPSHRVIRAQATPADLTYSFKILTDRRSYADKVLKHVLKVFKVDGMMELRDSLGDVRTYDAYRESYEPLDDIYDVGDRTVGYSVTVRVEGEYDDADETVVATASTALTLRARGR